MYKKISVIALAAVFLFWGGAALAVIEVTPTPLDDVLVDEIVTPEDLGVEEADVLPDSFWYRFKRVGRAAQRLVTFDPVKQTELEFRHANQELADMQKMVERRGDEDAVDDSMKYIEKRLSKVADRAEKLTEVDSDRQRDIMEKLFDHEIKRQKVFERVEDAMEDDHMRERMIRRRDNVSEFVGDIVGELPIGEDMIEEVLIRQPGGDFKDIRNLEPLKRVEEKVSSERAKEALRRAQANTLRRVAKQTEKFDNKSREKFEKYLEHSGGDDVLRFEIMDELQEKFDDGETEFKLRIKTIRDKAASNFEKEFLRIDTEIKDGELRVKLKRHMMRRFSDEDDLDDDRFERLESFRAHIHTDGVEKEFNRVEEEELEKFLKAFPDAEKDVEKYKKQKEHIRRAVEAGDFEKVKLLEKAMKKLEEEVGSDPEKRKFLESFEEANREARQGFMGYLEGEDVKDFDDFISDDPEHLKLLKNIEERIREDVRDGLRDVHLSDKFEDIYFEQTRHLTDEQRRKVRVLNEEGDTFHKEEENRRRLLEQEFEQNIEQAGTAEERAEIEKRYRERRHEFEQNNEERERSLFEREIDLGCEDDVCRKNKRAAFDAERELDKKFRKEDEDRRMEILKQLEEEERKDFERTNNTPDDGNDFRGLCQNAEECENWCQDHRDDPKCKKAGAWVDEHGEDNRTDNWDEQTEKLNTEMEKKEMKKFENDQNKEDKFESMVDKYKQIPKENMEAYKNHLDDVKKEF